MECQQLFKKVLEYPVASCLDEALVFPVGGRRIYLPA
jgi:hypothetical protein